MLVLGTEDALEAGDGRPGAVGGVVQGGLAEEGAVGGEGDPGGDAQLVREARILEAAVAGDAGLGVADVDGRRVARSKRRRARCRCCKKRPN